MSGGTQGVRADDALETGKLHEQLARRLAREIVSGRLEVDSTFPPSEDLSARYGVSRTVSRETVQALASAGLVSVHHGRRSVVAPSSSWRFLDGLVKYAIAREQLSGELAADLFEVRAIMEEAATLRCAARATEAELRELVDRAHACLTTVRDENHDLDRDWLAEEDLAFHRAIATGANNHVLAHLVTDVRLELIPTWAADQLHRAEIITVWEEHSRIAELLLSGDGVAAREAMTNHMTASVRTTLRRVFPEGEQSAIDARWSRDA